MYDTFSRLWFIFCLLCPLQNLDALHDHLGTLYPGMRAPSFRCTEKDGSLLLHYYSERPGLEHIVIGIVKVYMHTYLQKHKHRYALFLLMQKKKNVFL